MEANEHTGTWRDLMNDEEAAEFAASKQSTDAQKDKHRKLALLLKNRCLKRRERLRE